MEFNFDEFVVPQTRRRNKRSYCVGSIVDEQREKVAATTTTKNAFKVLKQFDMDIEDNSTYLESAQKKPPPLVPRDKSKRLAASCLFREKGNAFSKSKAV